VALTYLSGLWGSWLARYIVRRSLGLGRLPFSTEPVKRRLTFIEGILESLLCITGNFKANQTISERDRIFWVHVWRTVECLPSHFAGLQREHGALSRLMDLECRRGYIAMEIVVGNIGAMHMKRTVQSASRKVYSGKRSFHQAAIQQTYMLLAVEEQQPM